MYYIEGNKKCINSIINLIFYQYLDIILIIISYIRLSLKFTSIKY